jgi:hypothetical protein
MRTVALLAAVLLLAAEALAQQPFTGRIKGRVVTAIGEHPVEGVGIAVQPIQDAAQTDAFGRFEIDLAKVVPNWSPGRKSSITLVFTKTGFENANSLLNCETVDARKCANLTVTLVRTFDDVELDAAMKEGLKPMISRDGLTLFLLPYDMVRQPDVNQVPDLRTESLMYGLHSSVNTHLQALVLDKGVPRPPDIGVKPVKEKVAATDTEKIKTWGMYLNALAMVGGSGVIRRDADGKGIADMSSTFTMIPKLQEFPSVEEVKDNLPVELLNPSELSKQLSTTWGYRTTFALCLAEFKRAKSKGDRQGLERVRAYLMAERAQLKGNDERVGQINEMLNLVDEELQR